MRFPDLFVFVEIIMRTWYNDKRFAVPVGKSGAKGF